MATGRGTHRIGFETSNEGAATLRAVNPTTGAPIDPAFPEATEAEIDRAVHLAARAFDSYRSLSSATRAAFLDEIADRIEALVPTWSSGPCKRRPCPPAGSKGNAAVPPTSCARSPP